MTTNPRSIPARATRHGRTIHRVLSWRRQSAGRSTGQAIVELALIMPVLLVLFAAGADLARLFQSQVSIESAARAGALEASSHPTSFVAGQGCDTSTNRVMCAVLTESSGGILTIAPSDVSLTCTPSPCAEALGSKAAATIAPMARVRLFRIIIMGMT